MLVAKLEKLPVIVLALIILFFPLVNLPWTSSQIDLNKQMFIYAVTPILGLSLILISFLKPSFIKFNLLDAIVALFCLSFPISSLLIPIDHSFSLFTESLPMISVLTLYLLIRQINVKNNILIITSLVLSASISSLIVLSQLVNAKSLFISPISIQTTSNIWHSAGSPFATLWLIAISIPLCLGLIITLFKSPPKIITNAFALIIGRLLSIILLVYLVFAANLIIRPLFPQTQNTLPPVVFLDHQTGWKILLNTLSSSPLTGVGPGNFIDAFTLFKPKEFNQSPFWNIRFVTSSNLPFYLGTVTGIVGLLTYLFLITALIPKSFSILQKQASLEKSLVLSVIVIIIFQFLFPASFFLMALFLIIVALMANLGDSIAKTTPAYNLQPSLTIPLTIFSFILLYYVGTNYYQAEVYAQKATLTLQKGNGITTLENLAKAKTLAPYIDNLYVISSQVNLAIAANIIANTATSSAQIRDNNLPIIQNYFKISVDDAKKATEIAPARSTNWENLAKSYRQIANIVENAAPWVVSSYQKAIETDPTNPRLLLDYGGIFFGDKQYATASAIFQKAIDLKPDYNNAHYNLAHALFQQKKYQDAVLELEKAITLTSVKSPDYSRAIAELELFKTELTREKIPLPQASPSPLPTQAPSLSDLGNLSNLQSTLSATTSSRRRILILEEPLNVATGSPLLATPAIAKPTGEVGPSATP